MVVGIVAAAALCILILLYAMYKYRNRDEGSYHVDESRNYISNSATQPNGAAIKEKPIGVPKNKKDKKNKDKEYYVWSHILPPPPPLLLQPTHRSCAPNSHAKGEGDPHVYSNWEKNTSKKTKLS